MKGLSKVITFTAVLGLAAASGASAQELGANQYRVYTRESPPPEWSGDLWSYEAYGSNRDQWPLRGQTRGVQSLITWGTYGPDEEGNTPVKYILYFVSDKCTSSYKPWGSPESTKAWFELKGENQADFVIEVGTDVHQLVDPNPQGGWEQMFMVVEFSNGARYPCFAHFEGGEWQGDGAVVHRYQPGKENADKLMEPHVVAPKGYKWEAGTFTLGEAEAPASEAPAEDDGSGLKPGHYRVLVRGKAPEWTGEAWSFDGSGAKYGWRSSRVSDKQILVSWPEAGEKDGMKPVKYILIFTGPPAGSHCPFWTAENTRKVFGVRAENQAPFVIETAPDVHMLHDTHGGGVWDRMYVVAEYPDGSREPFTAEDGAVEFAKDKVRGPCIRTPNGYWKDNGTFRCEE